MLAERIPRHPDQAHGHGADRITFSSF